MATPSISGIEGATPSPASGEAAFDAALDKALGDDFTPEMEAIFIQGAITVGGQMIMMPRANDILGEAMSDE